MDLRAARAAGSFDFRTQFMRAEFKKGQEYGDGRVKKM
jgi:hypothetical protein